jgi:hypothetical protein
MKLLQLLIAFWTLTYITAAKAAWITEPYLGYGQISLKLGDEMLINGESTSYVLGARTGYKMGANLLLAADYSRAGPYNLKFKNRYYGTSIDSGLFTLYTAGLGIELQLGQWMLWLGGYPYHTLEEHKIDMQMKGSLRRAGLGFSLDAKTSIYFQYESSELKMENPSSTAQSIICYNTNIDQCKKTGTATGLSFIITAHIN